MAHATASDELLGTLRTTCHGLRSQITLTQQQLAAANRMVAHREEAHVALEERHWTLQSKHQVMTLALIPDPNANIGPCSASISAVV